MHAQLLRLFVTDNNGTDATQPQMITGRFRYETSVSASISQLCNAEFVYTEYRCGNRYPSVKWAT